MNASAVSVVIIAVIITLGGVFFFETRTPKFYLMGVAVAVGLGVTVKALSWVYNLSSDMDKPSEPSS